MKGNVWTLLAFVGIMVIMIAVWALGQVSVRTYALAIQNQRMELNMKQEFKQRPNLEVINEAKK